MTVAAWSTVSTVLAATTVLSVPFPRRTTTGTGVIAVTPSPLRWAMPAGQPRGVRIDVGTVLAVSAPKREDISLAPHEAGK